MLNSGFDPPSTKRIDRFQDCDQQSKQSNRDFLGLNYCRLFALQKETHDTAKCFPGKSKRHQAPQRKESIRMVSEGISWTDRCYSP